MWTSCRVPLLSDTVPGLSGRVRLHSYLEFLLFRLRAISLTACAWDITILKPYCMKKTEREQDVVTKNQSMHICVSLCCVFSFVPDSSWLLSSTWCKHAHHLFGWQGGSSWWFCCWKLSHSCNRWERPISSDVKFNVFKLKLLSWVLYHGHVTFAWSVSYRVAKTVTEKEGWEKKNVDDFWGYRCIMGFRAAVPVACGQSACYYVEYCRLIMCTYDFFIQF